MILFNITIKDKPEMINKEGLRYSLFCRKEMFNHFVYMGRNGLAES